MSSKTKNFIERNLNIIFFILLIFIIILYLFEVFIPFLIAFIITYLTNPLKIYLDKYVNETFSSFLSIIAFILCFLLILVLILPILIFQIQNLVLLLPGYLEEIEIFLSDINAKYLFTEKIKTVDYTSLIKPVTDSLINSSNNIIDNSIQFINSFFNMILIFVISFYLSIEFNKIKKFVYNMADKSNFTDFHSLIREIDVVLSKFIRGQGFVCLVLSVIYSLGLFLVGIKFGILLGIFAGIISFVPYLGSFIGGGLTLILGFSQFGISSQLIFITIIFISGQLFESYFLTPKLVGEAIKLNPIWIIFALMTGAYLSGFVGILISLPIAAIVGVVARHYFLKLF